MTVVGVTRNPIPTSSAVQFYYPTKASPTFWIEVKAPEFGNQEGIDKRQVIDISAAGEQIVYTRGPKTYTLSLAFSQLGRTERDAIETFFDSYTDGARNTFQYRQPRYDMTAPDGTIGLATLYTGCELEAGSMSFTEERNGVYGVSFTIRASGRTTTG